MIRRRARASLAPVPHAPHGFSRNSKNDPDWSRTNRPAANHRNLAGAEAEEGLPFIFARDILARSRMPESNTTFGLPWTGERLIPGIGGDITLEHLHRYAIARELAKGKDVLDIASGEGYGSRLLSGVAKSVVGVDVASDAVAHAQKTYGVSNLSFKVGRCQAIPLPAASVDLVVSFETIEHITEQEVFISEVKRVLRPDGHLLLSSPNKSEYDEAQTTSNIYHVRELSLGELKGLLAGAFKNNAWFGQRISHASVAFSLDPQTPPGFRYYTGNYDTVGQRQEFTAPMFLLVLSGDGELPEIDDSLFENGELLDKTNLNLKRARKTIDALQKDAGSHEKRMREMSQRLQRIEGTVWWRVRKPGRFLQALLRSIFHRG